MHKWENSVTKIPCIHIRDVQIFFRPPIPEKDPHKSLYVPDPHVKWQINIFPVVESYEVGLELNVVFCFRSSAGHRVSIEKQPIFWDFDEMHVWSKVSEESQCVAIFTFAAGVNSWNLWNGRCERVQGNDMHTKSAAIYYTKCKHSWTIAIFLLLLPFLIINTFYVVISYLYATWICISFLILNCIIFVISTFQIVVLKVCVNLNIIAVIRYCWKIIHPVSYASE